MTYHVCVWIDHREAKIFELTAGDVHTTRVEDGRPAHHLHRRANHIGLGTIAVDEPMLDEVAERLRTAKGILIVGPGKAKSVLRSYLEDHHPEISRNVWDVQASDHPTDAQLVATARAWFRAQGRMHP
jgi:stalled ribosome rescue protein Dom34